MKLRECLEEKGYFPFVAYNEGTFDKVEFIGKDSEEKWVGYSLRDKEYCRDWCDENDEWVLAKEPAIWHGKVDITDKCTAFSYSLNDFIAKNVGKRFIVTFEEDKTNGQDK